MVRSTLVRWRVAGWLPEEDGVVRLDTRSTLSTWPQHGALEMVLMEEGLEAEKLMERLMEYEGKKNSSIIKNEDELEATLSENVLLVKEENKLQELSPGFSDSILV